MALLVFKTSGTGTTRPVGSIPAASAMTASPPPDTPDRPDRPLRRGTTGVVVGALGLGAVALGYLLEVIRQRGTCDDGNASPDTLGLSVVLILFVGGAAGLVALVAAIVASRAPDRRLPLVGIVLACAALLGAGSIFVFAGGGPGDLFQNCGS